MLNKSKKGLRVPSLKKKGKKKESWLNQLDKENLVKKNSSKKKTKKDLSTSTRQKKGEKNILCKNIIFMDNLHNNFLCSTGFKSIKKTINNNMKSADKNKEITKYKKELLSILQTNEDDYSVFFTSGESESNNIILCSAVNAYKKIRKIKPHVVISSVEHESIIKYANSLKDSDQIELSIIMSNSYGCVLSQDIEKYIRPNTCLVMISYINYKIGSVNNINKIAQILHDKKIPLHSDCTFLLGNHKLDLSNNNIDAVTISFNKINAPLGIGALIVRNKLLNGYRLYEHSITLDNKCDDNISLIHSSIDVLKDKLNNRKKKNLKLLKYRNEIITKLGKNNQVLTFANFMKSDEPPLTDCKKGINKLVILGPPIDNDAYYTPSILSFIIITNKHKNNIYIKDELEKKNIIIGIPTDDEQPDFYDNIGIPVDAKQYIIRISLSDSLSSSDVDMFIKKICNIVN
jgi:cysteine sulfinate desulfinase/cysteine desulfurase-like protein